MDLRKVVPTTESSAKSGGPLRHNTSTLHAEEQLRVSGYRYCSSHDLSLLVPGCCLQGDCRDLSLERKYLVFGILSKCETD